MTGPDAAGIRVRELDDGQLEPAVELWRACGLTRPWNDPLADARRALAGPSSALLGAFADEQLLGTAMVGHDGHRGWVYYLAVIPGTRRGGVGRALMAAAEQWCLDRGVPKVQLMVRDGNEAAQGFYAALGYTDQRTTVLGKFLDPELQARKEREASSE